MYPALPHNSTTFWNMDYPILQQTQCQRCGQEHFHAGQCKALTRKCFKCGDYGHYGKFCQMTASRNNTGAGQKSQKRKQRDIQRYINFRDRKSVCMELPFYSLETSELIDLMPNWKTVRILELQEECDDLQVHLEIGVVVYEQTKSNLDQVHQEKEDLQKQISELSSTVSDLQNQNEEFCKQISQLKLSVTEAEQKSDLLNSQLRKVFQFSVKLDSCCVEFEHLTEHLIEEFEEVVLLDRHPDKTGPPCHRCGTISHVTRASCPANGHYCCKCGKMNHFAVVCERGSLPEVETDDETAKLLKTLVTTTGIKFEKSIKCVSCDDDSF